MDSEKNDNERPKLTLKLRDNKKLSEDLLSKINKLEAKEKTKKLIKDEKVGKQTKIEEKKNQESILVANDKEKTALLQILIKL